ncbi:histidine kinase [Wukongibacter baidiensis]|uniref:sensor histidine kinase n=1 Tax=Wukongibacter baidiensis TaxID=1723361 RepID=UPI003D7F2FB4
MSSSKFISIKRKLLLTYLIIIMSMGLVNVFLFINSSLIKNQYNEITNTIFILNSLSKKMKETNKSLEGYIFTHKRETIDEMYNNQWLFMKLLRTIDEDLLDDVSQLYVENIYNLVNETYIDLAEKTIWSVRGIEEEKTTEFFREATKIGDYVDRYLKMLMDKQLEQSDILHKQNAEQANNILRVNILLVIFNILLGGIIAYSFSKRTVETVYLLHDTAEKIYEGDLDIEEIHLDSKDEFDLLADSLNKLNKNTKNLIHKIKKNAELEVRLHKEESEKLKMSTLLKEAELLALQSQINPHFLFNTLNIISKTALIEEADKTCTLIESVSDMFRYNLKKLNDIVTIRDEIRVINEYLFIQKTRFRDRVSFLIDVDEEIMDIKIPHLTLQPIVENAFIHGIEGYEEGGEIKILGKIENGDRLLIIEDNGPGIAEERIKEIFYEGEIERETDIKGHTTGIGLKNVKRRLELFFNSNEVFSIDRTNDRGTKIIIKLPHDLRGENNV